LDQRDELLIQRLITGVARVGLIDRSDIGAIDFGVVGPKRASFGSAAHIPDVGASDPRN
jgi:hypothetical protein